MTSGDSPAVLVHFKGSADLSAAYGMPYDARAPYVYQTLTAYADRMQTTARATLASQFNLSESDHDYTVLWIDNSIAISHLTGPMLSSLESDPNIASIETQKLIPSPQMPGAEQVAEINGTDPIVSSLEHIHVPEVWNAGYHGEGIVVANIDTGVRYTHHALVNQYRGNLGGGTFDHNKNWYDPYNHSAAPRQTANHGSHTMGTIVGDNVDFFPNPPDRHQTGAAPKAKWIACIGFGAAGGSATNAGLLECGQWTIAPYDTSGSGTPDP
ncbi:MAG TPA: S8 family serine peptidase, partial [Vicinamibacterales bacterium]|nr:S8 family serine peptidase [Vicinamibacterales bacterium]